WHHQDDSTLPSDGSALGSNDGLAGVSAVTWRRTPNFHSITEFENLPDDAAALCDPTGKTGIPCPVQSYRSGGPGFLVHSVLNRYQGRVVGTYLLSLLGHHVMKAGVDIESVSLTKSKAYSGSFFY